MGKHDKVTHEQVMLMRQLYKEPGATIHSVAAQVKLSPGTVRSYTQGMKRAGPSRNEELREAVKRMRNEEGLTYQIIADHFGISKERIRQLLN